jgi:hypothetical protein
MMRQVPLRLDPLGSVSGSTKSSAAPAPTVSRAALPADGAPKTATGDGGGETPSQGSPPPAGTDSATEAAPIPAPEQAAPPSESPLPATDQNKAKPVAPAAARSQTESAAAAAAGERGKPDAQVAVADVAPRPASAASGFPAELALLGPGSVRVGDEFEVVLEATVREPLQSLPLIIRFDPQVLSFVDAQPEALARTEGSGAAVPKVDPVTGRLDFELQLAPDAAQAGKSKLLRLRFTAKAARAQTRITLGQVTLPGGEGLRTIPRPPTLLVRVAQ